MNTRMKRIVSLTPALALMAAALLAASAEAQDVASFKLTARDGVFDPAVLGVTAGKRFRIEIVNEGKTAIEFESRDLKQEKVIPPGGKAVITINALKAGEYKFFDEFHEKTGQGKIIAK
jgi:plastocyanin